MVWESKDKFKRGVQAGDVMISSNGNRYIARTEQNFFAFDYDISALFREVWKDRNLPEKPPTNEEIAFLLGLFK